MTAPTAGGSDGAPQSAAIAFNEAINRRDLRSLSRLMTDDHTFIDSDDNVLAGKEEALKAWEGFFDAFPTIEMSGRGSPRSAAR